MLRVPEVTGGARGARGARGYNVVGIWATSKSQTKSIHSFAGHILGNFLVSPSSSFLIELPR